MLKNFVLMVGALFVGSPASLSAGEKSKDANLLRGTWQMVAATIDGKVVKETESLSQLAFSDGHVSYPSGVRNKFILHEGGDPKGVDLFIAGDDKLEKKLEGVYSLTGDSLRLCLAKPDQKRPDGFASKPGSGHMLYFLKRVSRDVAKWPERPKVFGKRLPPRFVELEPGDLDLRMSTKVDDKLQVEVQTFQGLPIDFVMVVMFSPNGRTLACGNASAEVTLWNLAQRRPVALLKGHAKDISAIAFSPDGKMLATGSLDMTVELWDLETRKHLATLYPGTGSVRAIAFHPKGEALVVATTAGELSVWDAAASKHTRTFRSTYEGVHSVAFTPDGKTLISAGQDKKIRVWDYATGQVLDTLEGHTDLISTAIVSPDGELLASASRDSTIKLWDLPKRQVLATLHGHKKWVTSLAFRSDGRILASGSADQDVKLWDVKTAKQVATLPGHGGFVMGVAFAPHENVLVSGGWDNCVKFWRFLTPKKK